MMNRNNALILNKIKGDKIKKTLRRIKNRIAVILVIEINNNSNSDLMFKIN